jgi:hypothetical protein
VNQPTKDTLREQLALAADEIIRLRTELKCFDEADVILWRTPPPFDRIPWLRRLFGADKCKAACEADNG